MPNETMVYIYTGLAFIITGLLVRIAHELITVRKLLQDKLDLEFVQPKQQRYIKSGGTHIKL